MGETNYKVPITVEVSSLIKRLIYSFLAFIVVFSLVNAKEEKNKKEGKIDYIKVAAVLIKDGYYDRAIKILNEVNPNDKEIDKKQYFTLKGYAYYKLGNLKNAVKYFEKAYGFGNKKKSLILYLIDSYYKLKDCKNTIKWIDNGKSYTQNNPKFYLIKINCYKKLGNIEKVLETLDNAIEKFPKNLQFYKIKFYTFLSLKLYRPSIETAKAFLNTKNIEPEDYILVAKALIASKQYDEAIRFLEKANLIYPNNEKILIALANSYYKKGRILTAAQIFEQASFTNPKYYKDAAELYRKAGDYYHALYLNSKVLDLKIKLKQKVAIFLDMKRYSEIVNMEELLRMTGLINNDIIKYTLAYSAFKIGDYSKAYEYLKQIKDDKLFRKATEILALIEKCKQNKAICY